MLRKILVGLGVVSLIGAALLAERGLYPPALWLAINGAALTAGIVFERWRYRHSHSGSATADWQATGERFIDPENGELVEVLFDPLTGERRYVPAAGGRSTKSDL